MALITTSQALNLSAPFQYTQEGTGYFVWHSDKLDLGPIGFVTKTPGGHRWKGQPIRCSSVGSLRGKFIGSFKDRRTAAHAVAVA